ncbi:hypothetical protein P4050_16500, partial [Pseudomonas aeruginosa]|nr:hypothetical protein [Pseudomonas aeruginosa]
LLGMKMQITKLTLHRFKKYRDKEISIKPGLSLLPDLITQENHHITSFRSWEFCKTVLEMEKGSASIRQGYAGQGLRNGSR